MVRLAARRRHRATRIKNPPICTDSLGRRSRAWRAFFEDCLARPKILLLGALFGALHGCATKAPPKGGALHRNGSSDLSVRVAVMPADSLLYADVARAL